MKPVTVQEVIEKLGLAWKTNDWFMVDDLNNRIRTYGIAPPDGMRLVPIEPTEEMILSAEEAYTPFGDMGMALLCGNLAAAPKQENSNE